MDNPVYVKLDSFDRDVSFSISEYVPDSLIDEVKKCTSAIDEICAGALCRTAGDWECLDSKPRDYCNKLKSQPSDEELKRFIAEAAALSLEKNPTVRYKRNCSNTPICVHGKLDFKDDLDNSHTLKFASIVVLERPGRGVPRPPSYTYNLFLKAGKSGYEERKSISQEIKPGDADNFLIKVATDRSASFNFSMDIVAAGGAVVWTGNFEMSLLLPRSGAKLIGAAKQIGPAGPNR